MISAVILAAGKSRRMGRPKMLLPWGDTVVLGHVISVFAAAGLEDILVVTGAVREKIEGIVSEYGKDFPVRTVYNEDYQEGEMLSSLKCGLRDLAGSGARAALIGLGDQPQVQEKTVRLVCESFRLTGSPLVIPSFQMRRGHPWLASRRFWMDLLELHPSQTPRDFLDAHRRDIQYVEVDAPSILADLDTPEDYRASRS